MSLPFSNSRADWVFGLALLGLLSGCSVGPNYHRPAPVALPMDWHWKPAEPRDELAKGPWWRLFGDPELNRLEELAVAQNQNLQEAVGRVDVARARARLSGSSFFPQITAAPSYSRTQLEADQPEFSVVPIPGILSRFPPYNTFSVPLDLSYEVDIWGRVRRSFQAAQAQAQASVADYQNVLLTLNSDVAVDYLTLREYDSEVNILAQTVKARTESLRINKVRVEAGRATNVDVAQAATDLTNAEAQLDSVQQSRAETADALALLCGSNATDLTLPVHPLNDLKPPLIPVGLPASLLERRPDVAEAERTMAARNEQIGVAYAAFFPAVSLTGQGGVISARASDLFHWQNTMWSFGPSISIPLFDGGQNLSNLQIARAQYNQSVASYRSSVLSAVRDVEDALADLRFLARETAALQQSVISARQAIALENRRFLVGETNYTDVIVSDETRLNTERNASQVRGQQLYATVRLIKALGGGWDARELGPEKPAPIPFGTQASLPGQSGKPD
jgi:multidrug efflux system outer membrane protein